MIECNMLDAYRDQIVSFFFSKIIRKQNSRHGEKYATPKKLEIDWSAARTTFNLIRSQLN